MPSGRNPTLPNDPINPFCVFGANSQNVFNSTFINILDMFNMKVFNIKVFVVTGATDGIGKPLLKHVSRKPRLGNYVS
ncbi:hypothetical protein AB3N60_15855 [Leptospira sp. WS39.C2]